MQIEALVGFFRGSGTRCMNTVATYSNVKTQQERNISVSILLVYCVQKMWWSSLSQNGDVNTIFLSTEVHIVCSGLASLDGGPLGYSYFKYLST